LRLFVFFNQGLYPVFVKFSTPMSDEAEQNRLEKVERGQQVEFGETVEAFSG
jgi:hypothetical protein